MQQTSDVVSWFSRLLQKASDVEVEVRGEPPHSFDLEAEGELGVGRRDVWLTTEGCLSYSPELVETRGSLALKPPNPSGTKGVHELDVEAYSGGHWLEGRHVLPYEGVWSSRDTAVKAVKSTVDGFAESMDVDADVRTVEYEHGDGVVEIRHETDVDDLGRAAAEYLYRWSTADCRVETPEVDIQRVSLGKENRDGEAVYSWVLEVEGQGELFEDLYRSLGLELDAEISRLRRDAGLEVEVGWSLDTGDEVYVDVDYTSSGSRDYLDLLEEHGAPRPPESEFSFRRNSDDGGSTEIRYSSVGVGDGGSLVGEFERWRAFVPPPLKLLPFYYRELDS